MTTASVRVASFKSREAETWGESRGRFARNSRANDRRSQGVRSTFFLLTASIEIPVPLIPPTMARFAKKSGSAPRISCGVLIAIGLLMAIPTSCGSAVSLPGAAPSSGGSRSGAPEPTAVTIAAAPGGVVAVGAATAPAPAAAAEQSGGRGGGPKNMVVSLANYLKDSVVRTVAGCGQLWTNHGRCNDIRRKQTAFRATARQQWEATGLYDAESPKDIAKRLQLLQGGITYDDYIFLQRGKEDRGKVLNLGFMMWGAPRLLPYALMFNPEMLPSPFKVDKQQSAIEPLAQTISRERAHAFICTLLIMERKAVAASGGYLSRMNIFGKKKQQEEKNILGAVVAETGDYFRREMPIAPAAPVASQLLDRLAPVLYKTGVDYTRAEQRLCQVPACIVQGIGRAVSGQGVPGILAQLTPAFLHRGKLVGHIQKVAAADDFLVQAVIDLETVPKRLLQEACLERLMDAGPHRSVDDLRASLSEWLHLTAAQPAEAVRKQIGLAPTGGSKEEESMATTPPVVYYNGNLARMVLLAYYGCATVRDDRCTSRLPQLLCAPPKKRPNADGTTNSNKETKKRLIPFLQ